MPIKRCILDGRVIHSLADLYDRLENGLALSGHFGRNLDALRDVLSTDVEGPLAITWKHSGESKKRMGKDYQRIVKLLRELEKERDDFQLAIEP